MATSGESLAERFEAANAELISTVESLSPEQWKRTCPDEGWTVGVTLHHLGESLEGVGGMVRAIAEKQPLPPLSADWLNERNAEHATRAADVTSAETLDLIRTNGKSAAEMLRSLSDEQLQNTAPMPLAGGAPMTAGQVAENVLIGHTFMHLKGVKAATA